MKDDEIEVTCQALFECMKIMITQTVKQTDCPQHVVSTVLQIYYHSMMAFDGITHDQIVDCTIKGLDAIKDHFDEENKE